jgi:hypothetical protein
MTDKVGITKSIVLFMILFVMNSVVYAQIDSNGKLKIDGAGIENGKSPGIVYKYAPNDDFYYDGEYLNHYGFGFHGYQDPSVPHTNPRNTYMSGFFGIDLFTGGESRLRITRNGKVGIGTNNPDSKLVVAGKAHVQEIKVEVDAGADYVFERSYPLPDLRATEQFVKQNKHLPGIPSAQEMKEQGLELGEFNIQLLKKVEELTLIVIQQDKKLLKQQDKLDRLNQLEARIKQLESIITETAK